MNRRRFLATAATTGTAVSITGCSSPMARSLSPTVEDDGPGELVIHFSRDDSEVATAVYYVGRVVDEWVRFRVSLSHSLDGVRSFRLRFRPITGAGEAPPRVLLERPGGQPYPSYSFEAEREYGWTRFEVPDLASQAPGTFTVEFWFGGVERAVDVSTDLRAELDGGLDLRSPVAEAIATVDGRPSDAE